MKKSVLAAFLSGVMVATNAVTAFATDVGEEIILLDEEEIVLSDEEEISEEIEEEISEEPQEDNESDLQEEAEEAAEEETDAAPDAVRRTIPATGHVSAIELNITNQGGNDEEAFFNEEYPAKYVTPALPPLRNQSIYGTCWAHATIGLLEINMMKSGLIPEPDFSELHLAHFYYDSAIDPLGGTEGDYIISNDPFGALNYGGDGIVGLDILSGWCGAASEELVPYSYAPLVGSYGIRDSLAYDDVAHLKNYYVTNLNREKFLTFKNPNYLNPLKKMVMEYGAADISFGASDGYSPVYDGMIYNEETGAYYNPSQDTINHEVVVVGWDDNYPKENFGITPPRDGAFLVRNSWTDEGDIDHPDYSGYFWMSYYEASLGEQIYGAEVTTADNYDNNYQYDGFMFNGMGVIHKGANVFTAHAKDAEEGENLKAVSVFILDENSNYTVEVYRNLTDLNNPESGTKEATVTGTSTFAGRYTVPLNKSIFLEPGETFAVVVTTSYDGVAYDLSTGTELTYNDITIFNLSAKEGQSFSYEDGEWKSMEDNLKIKAYTDNVVGTQSEAQGIRLDNVSEETVKLGLDETFKVNYTVYPLSASKTPVTVTSSNPEVASVTNGVVTGLSEGTATITLETENGKTTGFDVEVIKKLKTVTVSFDDEYYEDDVKKCQCYYVLDPDDYVPESVVWESSDESVVTVDQNGLVTFVGLGDATVSVTIDGVRGTEPFYGMMSDNQVYYEVTDNNTVYIKWVPIEGVDSYSVWRDYQQIDYFSGDSTVCETVDTYYAENPVTEPVYVDYEIWLEIGFSLIPYSFTVTIYSAGDSPVDPVIEDWGDIWQEGIMMQLDYDLTNIPDGVWYYVNGTVQRESAALTDTDFVYTGKEMTLEDGVTVFYRNRLLKEGKDYTVTYKNNVNASKGGASVTVTGKGDYDSSATFTFDIAKAEINNANLSDGYMVTIDKKKKKKLSTIRPQATYEGMTLKEGIDFTYQYAEPMEGEQSIIEDPSKVILSDEEKFYTVYMIATEEGNFEGELLGALVDVYDFSDTASALDFKIGDSKGKALKVSYEEVNGEAGSEDFIKELFDNSEDKTPKAYVFYKGKKLVYGKDFQAIADEEDYKSVGEHTVYILGEGDYAGAKYCSFRVTGTDISKARVAGLVTRLQYTGYELSLGDLFDQDDKNLEADWEGVTLYTKDKSGKTRLAEEDIEGNGDYTVTLSGAKDPGKYTLVFTGINGCCGELKKTITITPYDIKKDSEKIFYTFTGPGKYSKAGAKPKVEVTFGHNREMTLIEGVDYVITCKNNKKIFDGNGKNAPSYTVKGIGNFKGTIKVGTFRIFKGNGDDMKLETRNIKYKKNGADGYFFAKFKFTESGHAVSVGAGKEVEKIAPENVLYTYADDAVMENGTVIEAGNEVLPTDRPVAGTRIKLTVYFECGENSPYFTCGLTSISTVYTITK